MKRLILFPLFLYCVTVFAQMNDREKMIMKQVAEAVQKIESSDLIIKNDSLTNYINSVALKLFGREIIDKYKIDIKIIRDKDFNAFAFPDGHIYIHSGLLGQMDNEAQLAALIGHESIHVINGHAFKGSKNLEDKANSIALLNILTAGIGGGLIGLAGSITGELSIYGYARDLETEADVFGLDYYIKAGYDPNESTVLFQHLIDQLKANKIEEPYYYSTHPKLSSRIEKYKELLNKNYRNVKSDFKNETVFYNNASFIIALSAEMMIAANQPQFAKKSIGRLLDRDSLSANNWYLRAEMQRKLSANAESDSVVSLYSKSISCDSTFAPSLKRLGVIHYKKKDYRKCVEYLEKYFVMVPDDKDRKFLQSYIDKSKKEINL